MKIKAEGLKGFLKKIKDASSSLITEDEVEIFSNRYALISGCRKLTEYSDSKITLSMSGMTLTVVGECLEPESLINGRMAIRGIIKEVLYERD